MTATDFDWRQLGTMAIVVVFLIVFSGVLVATVPQVVGADHSFVVRSDSMSPAIDAGAVVVVSDASVDRITERDVITYVDSGDGDQSIRITHRVVDVRLQDGQRYFRTKGDANAQPDPGFVSPSAVVGVVQFHLPLIGYVVTFAKSKAGIASLIVLPALSLLGFEVRNLYHAYQRDKSKISDPADDGSG